MKIYIIEEVSFFKSKGTDYQMAHHAFDNEYFLNKEDAIKYLVKTIQYSYRNWQKSETYKLWENAIDGYKATDGDTRHFLTLYEITPNQKQEG